MHCNLLKSTVVVAIGICACVSSFADTVPTTSFYVGDTHLCFYPNGYVGSNASPMLYQIVDNSNHEYGARYEKVAIFRGLNTFADPDAAVNSNTILPQFIFCDGQFLPVAAVNGGFKDSSASVIWLQDNVMRLEDLALEGADNVTEITLPASLNYLGSEALSTEQLLSKIYFRSPLPPALKIDLTSQFSEIWTMGKTVGTMPAKYETPFGNSKMLDKQDPEYGNPEIIIPEGTLSFYMENPLFRDFSLRTKEYAPEYPQIMATGLPEGMKFVDISDFRVEIQEYDNPSIRVELPAKVASASFSMGYDMQENPYRLAGIGKDFLKGCTGTDEIIIPDGVEYIKEGAFRGCSAKKVKIGKDVRYVADNVFAEMPNLETVEWTLPDEGYAFYCESMFKGTPEQTVLLINTSSPLFDAGKAPFRYFNNIEGSTSGISTGGDIATLHLTATGSYGKIILTNNGVLPAEAVIAGVSGQILYSGTIASGIHEITAQPGIYLMKEGSRTIKLIVK